MHLNCIDVATDFALSVFCDGPTTPGCKLLPQNPAATCAAAAPGSSGPSAGVIAGSIVGVAAVAAAGMFWYLRRRGATRSEAAPLLKGGGAGAGAV